MHSKQQLIKAVMGNTSVKNDQFGDRAVWQLMYPKNNAVEVLKHLPTQREVEKKTLPAQNYSDIQIQLKIYNLRMKELVNCVQVLYFSHDQSKCVCGSPDRITVVIEKTRRLNEVGWLTLPQAKYMLRQAIIGFYNLFQVFGLFNIRPQFISINDEGKTRTWLNQDYFSNNIDQPAYKTVDEKAILDQLFSIIQNRIHPDDFLGDLKGDLVRAKTFIQAVTLIQAKKNSAVKRHSVGNAILVQKQRIENIEKKATTDFQISLQKESVVAHVKKLREDELSIVKSRKGNKSHEVSTVEPTPAASQATHHSLTRSDPSQVNSLTQTPSIPSIPSPQVEPLNKNSLLHKNSKLSIRQSQIKVSRVAAGASFKTPIPQIFKRVQLQSESGEVVRALLKRPAHPNERKRMDQICQQRMHEIPVVDSMIVIQRKYPSKIISTQVQQ